MCRWPSGGCCWYGVICSLWLRPVRFTGLRTRGPPHRPSSYMLEGLDVANAMAPNQNHFTSTTVTEYSVIKVLNMVCSRCLVHDPHEFQSGRHAPFLILISRDSESAPSSGSEFYEPGKCVTRATRVALALRVLCDASRTPN